MDEDYGYGGGGAGGAGGGGFVGAFTRAARVLRSGPRTR